MRDLVKLRSQVEESTDYARTQNNDAVYEAMLTIELLIAQVIAAERIADALDRFISKPERSGEIDESMATAMKAIFRAEGHAE